MDTLSSYGTESIMVPKNMTHLQQSLDLTTNTSFKKNEKRAFSEYFTSCIMETLTNDPDRDVTTIQVGLRLSILKPRNARVMTDIYQYLKSQRGKEIIKAGWREAGITDVLKDSREGSENTIRLNRSSRLEVFCEKGVLRNFAKFTGKHLCQSLFFNKVAGLWHRCFPVNFAKIFKSTFFTEHLGTAASKNNKFRVRVRTKVIITTCNHQIQKLYVP